MSASHVCQLQLRGTPKAHLHPPGQKAAQVTGVPAERSGGTDARAEGGAGLAATVGRSRNRGQGQHHADAGCCAVSYSRTPWTCGQDGSSSNGEGAPWGAAAADQTGHLQRAACEAGTEAGFGRGLSSWTARGRCLSGTAGCIQDIFIRTWGASSKCYIQRICAVVQSKIPGWPPSAVERLSRCNVWLPACSLLSLAFRKC